MKNFIADLQARVKHHAAHRIPLSISGTATKIFYGGKIVGEPLVLSSYSGVIDYQPRELVLTVRAGTPLAVIETVLAAEKQMLPFEPPYFGEGGTIGGIVASGLSGPRRPYVGAVRDFILGTRLLSGKGEVLRFGGQVIKNVAGYDVSRLMSGAMGSLGILLDLTFKVLPRPVAEITLCFEANQTDAIRRMNEWAGKPLPLSATMWYQGKLMVRLSGGKNLAAVRQKMGGEKMPDHTAAAHWRNIANHAHIFFQGDMPLWRLSLPQTAAPLGLENPELIEWGGGLRWLRGDWDAKILRSQVQALGGHATLFRGGDKSAGVFHPLDPVLAKVHRNLKNAFDPANILNRGRMDNF